MKSPLIRLIISKVLIEAGYLTGNIHKRDYILPLEAFNWIHDNESLGLLALDGEVGRDP